MSPLFEARMAEIDVELKNLGAEMGALGTSIAAIEKGSADARIKYGAIVARRQMILALLRDLRRPA